MRLKHTALVAAAAATLLVAAPIGGADAACSVSTYLTQGQRGSSQVKCLQQTLNAKGFNSGPTDGYFGPVTRQAVVNYQSANGLAVDGEVGSQTGRSLGVWSAQARQQRSTQRSTARTTSQRSTRQSAPSGSSGVNWANVAQCESGTNWNMRATNRTGTYGGAYAISDVAWRQFGGTEFAPNGGMATPQQQTIVAERIAARVGFDRAWSCDDD